jgi:hypothetical protein
MTRTIETEYPRTIVLENVAQSRPNSLRPDDVRRTAIALSRHIRTSGGAPIGPVIQRVVPQQDASGPDNQETTLLRQSSTPIVGSAEVRVDDRIEVNGCVLARFRGDASDIDIISSKLSVFAYEQEIELDGTVYLVFVDDNGMDLSVDAFAPVVAMDRHARR